jgi:hypothetical protein
MAKSAQQPPRRPPGGKPPTDKTPPHIRFVEQHKGTLPETITRRDIKILNAGLRHLFARLREARRLYDTEKDSGRAGAFNALAAAWQFIVLFKSPRSQFLQVPFLKLQDALAALEKNNVLPILKPVARRGRAPSSQAQVTLTGFAAGTVKRLLQAGMDHEHALATVAKTLAKQGVRSQRGLGAITATTVSGWYDEVKSDADRSGTAARAFDSMFLPEENMRFDALPPVEARQQALGSLVHYVKQLFPELTSTNQVKPPI